MPRHTYIRTTAGADIAEVKKFIFDTCMEVAPYADPEKIKIEFFDYELELLYQREDKLDTCYLVLVPLDCDFYYRSLWLGTLRDAVSPPRDRYPSCARCICWRDTQPLQPQVPLHCGYLLGSGYPRKLLHHRPMDAAVCLSYTDVVVGICLGGGSYPVDYHRYRFAPFLVGSE